MLSASDLQSRAGRSPAAADAGLLSIRSDATSSGRSHRRPARRLAAADMLGRDGATGARHGRRGRVHGDGIAAGIGVDGRRLPGPP